MSLAPALDPESLATLALAVCAVDPAGLGGLVLRAPAGPVRDRWLAQFQALLPEGTPLRRLPVNAPDSRLLGGLDLAATLRAGRPVAERGVLADSNGGVVILPMAERCSAGMAARLAGVLDTGVVVLERDGFASRLPARLGVIALDEGLDQDEQTPAALRDRLAVQLDLTPLSIRAFAADYWTPAELAAARQRLPDVQADDEALEALCATALALGIHSLRAPLLALKTALAAAALDDRHAVTADDLALAASLVLAPRATQLPAGVPEGGDTEPQGPPDAEQEAGEADETEEARHQPTAPKAPQDAEPSAEAPRENNEDELQERILEAARAALPAGLLAQLQAGGPLRASRGGVGRSGAVRMGDRRGRPSGTRQGDPRARGARLNVVETLRAAAPWQPVRRRQQASRGTPVGRLSVRSDDFRVTRYRQRTETTSIFVVDASGSSAFQRLAEAKGAVELLLADCYVRRDRVALVAFRGRGAELLLPPTRSLVRAKRRLAGLPGGGGTPLAAGLCAAIDLAEGIRRRGDTPVIILLTDGRGNVDLQGRPGRQRAAEDTEAVARRLRAQGLAAVLIDTSPRAQPAAQALAASMAARYLPLPYADATTLSGIVRQAQL